MRRLVAIIVVGATIAIGVVVLSLTYPMRRSATPPCDCPDGRVVAMLPLTTFDYDESVTAFDRCVITCAATHLDDLFDAGTPRSGQPAK